MKKLLIINKTQFGYHTDSYKYCEYLNNDYKITYYCFDNIQPKMDIKNVRIIYVPSNHNFFFRGISFFYGIFSLTFKEKFDTIFVVNFDFCFVIPLFVSASKFILDIRTGSVAKSNFKRRIQDYKIKLNTLFFQNITIVSNSLGQKFRIKDYIVLPVGADIIDNSSKSYNKLNLLYIGVLSNRDIYKTVEGVSLFLKKTESTPSLRYDIIGGAKVEEIEKLNKTIRENNLQNIVFYHGILSHKEAKPFIKLANIGICFVPQTSYYDVQPSTKIFEYALSGLVTLATDTSENRAVINETNGLIFQDNPQSFSESLEKVMHNSAQYSETVIRNSLINYKWEEIIRTILVPLIEVY